MSRCPDSDFRGSGSGSLTLTLERKWVKKTENPRFSRLLFRVRSSEVYDS